MFKINNNLKIFLLILTALLVLFFTKGKYGEFSKSKSIQSCMIAQKKILKDKSIEEIKVFCEEEINKNCLLLLS